MNDQITLEQAAALVEADKQHRVKMAAEAIQRALSDYACGLVAAPLITPDGRITAQVQIIAK